MVLTPVISRNTCKNMLQTANYVHALYNIAKICSTITEGQNTESDNMSEEEDQEMDVHNTVTSSRYSNTAHCVCHFDTVFLTYSINVPK